jgi:hypothetical protein
VEIALAAHPQDDDEKGLRLRNPLNSLSLRLPHAIVYPHTIVCVAFGLASARTGCLRRGWELLALHRPTPRAPALVSSRL